ncbi:WXG100-like domain-containing protein [Streptosporangium canum]
MDSHFEALVPPIVRPYVGWIVGMDWPVGDEERCFQLSDAYREVAEAVAVLMEDGDDACLNVCKCMDGAASDAFKEYWKTFTTVEPLLLCRLKQGCERAGKQLNAMGLEIEYAKYMILLSLILLGAQITYFVAMAAPSFGRSLSLIPMACRLTQMTVRQIAMRLLRNIALFTGVMAGMDGLIQTIQMASGRREDWDWLKTGMSLAGGALAGLTFTGLGVMINKLGGARMASETVERLAMTGREKAAAFLDNSAWGMATQSMMANTAAAVPMLAANGQLSWEMLAKSATAGFLGGTDGHLISPTGRHGVNDMPSPVGHFPEMGNPAAPGGRHGAGGDPSLPPALTGNDPAPAGPRPAMAPDDPARVTPPHPGAADSTVVASILHDTGQPDPVPPSSIGSEVIAGDRTGPPQGQPTHSGTGVPARLPGDTPAPAAPPARSNTQAGTPATRPDTLVAARPDTAAAARPDTLAAARPDTAAPRADAPAAAGARPDTQAGTAAARPDTPAAARPDTLVAARPDTAAPRTDAPAAAGARPDTPSLTGERPAPGYIDRMLNPDSPSGPPKDVTHLANNPSASAQPHEAPVPASRDASQAGSAPHDPAASGAVPPRGPGDGAPPPADPPRSSDSGHGVPPGDKTADLRPREGDKTADLRPREGDKTADLRPREGDKTADLRPREGDASAHPAPKDMADDASAPRGADGSHPDGDGPASPRAAELLDELTAAREREPRVPPWLDRGIRSGIAGEPVLLGGRTGGADGVRRTWSVLVEKWTFNDGSHMIRKVLAISREADAEALAAIVGTSLGADVPGVYRAGDTVIYQEFKEGQHRAALPAEEVPLRPELTRSGMRISLLDVLITNPDRHSFNWLLSSEPEMITPTGQRAGVIGIDHNLSFEDPLIWAPKGEFGTQFVRGELTSDGAHQQYVGRPNPLSPEDIQGINKVLKNPRMKWEFERRGRLDWYHTMLSQLDMIARNAVGTEPRMPMPARVVPKVITLHERSPLSSEE